MSLYEQIESYCILQSLNDNEVKMMNHKGKEIAIVFFNKTNMMLPKNRVIISDDWFCIETHSRFVPQVKKILKKSGVPSEDISIVNSRFINTIYITSKPQKFLDSLMKFEKLIFKNDE